MQAPEIRVVTEEELASLPHLALVAMAGRAAWRLQVFDPADLDADQRMFKVTVLILSQRLARGLEIEGIPLSSLEPAQAARHDALLQAVWGAALDPEPLRFCLDALTVASQRFAEVQSQLVKQDPQATMGPNPCDAAARADYDWLADWSSQKRAADGLVPSQFFDRPLWQRGEGDEPPFPVFDYFKIWGKACEELRLGLLVDVYQAMLNGRPGKQFDRRLEELVGSWWADYQPRLHRQKPAQEPGPEQATKVDADQPQPEPPVESDDSAGEQPVSPPLLAGVVNAAADRPADEDHLGRRPLIETLADMLSYPGQALPMTIALLGDWGSGKSTVIHQLKARLQAISAEEQALDRQPSSGERKPRARYLFAEFNAWEYEQTNSMRAGLAQEVVNGLTHGLGKLEKLALAFRRARKVHFLEFWQTVATLLLAVLSVWVGIDLASPEDVQKALAKTQVAKELSGTGMIGVAFYLLFTVWRSGRKLLEHPMASQLNTYLKLPSYGKHLGEVPVIKRELETLCRMRLEDVPEGRLLVIVDDLDRCRPEAITETFDAIRLVMNMPNVAVIVAIDDRIAFRAVADHYRKLAEGSARTSEEIARDYLSKIIQLPVNLYEPWYWEVSEFVNRALFADAQEPEPQVAGQQSLPKADEYLPEITDAARKLAQDNSVDLRRLHGSGKEGRIVIGDVRGYLAGEGEIVEDTVIEEHESGEMRPHDFVELEIDDNRPETPMAAEQAQQQAERVYELMKDMAFERKLFAELARDLHFHNPRQLIRLKNSYSLLKGYRHNRSSRDTPDRRLGERMMHGLFWYEYLYQCTLEHRRRDELVIWFWSERPHWRERVAKDERRQQLPPALLMAERLERLHGLAQYRRDYLEVMKTVEMAILPNAQMGLIEDASDAERLLAAIEGKLDPFNDGERSTLPVAS